MLRGEKIHRILVLEEWLQRGWLLSLPKEPHGKKQGAMGSSCTVRGFIFSSNFLQ